MAGKATRTGMRFQGIMSWHELNFVAILSIHLVLAYHIATFPTKHPRQILFFDVPHLYDTLRSCQK
jgi:hypothetical protein